MAIRNIISDWLAVTPHHLQDSAPWVKLAHANSQLKCVQTVVCQRFAGNGLNGLSYYDYYYYYYYYYFYYYYLIKCVSILGPLEHCRPPHCLCGHSVSILWSAIYTVECYVLQKNAEAIILYLWPLCVIIIIIIIMIIIIIKNKTGRGRPALQSEGPSPTIPTQPIENKERENSRRQQWWEQLIYQWKK